MLWLIRWVVLAVMRAILACRYKVKVVGKPEVFQRPGPYLILPNHVALCDPPNLIVHLWPAFQMRPLLLETNFKSPILKPFKWLLRSIDMPDITRASAEDRRRAEEAVAEVIASLKRGENVIVWPSGRLTRDGTERVDVPEPTGTHIAPTSSRSQPEPK
jgi:long-chain-fatty-acid--[acyl-carrier-protein] ligase